MRILHVISELGIGGAEKVVMELAADAVARGGSVTVASGGGAWVERLEAVGGEHRHIPVVRRRPGAALATARSLRSVLAEVRPDLVHTHNVGVTVSTRLASVTLGSRPAVVTTFHGVAPEDYRAAARLLRVSTGRVVACAPSVAGSLVAAGFPSPQLDLVCNAAALEPAGTTRLERTRWALGIGERPLVVGVGRLVVQKSWATLIEAAPRLPPVDIVVAGEGPLRAELESQAATAGSRVRFVGAVDDVAALLGLAACFVSTSSWEGLPLSMLEALSLGVPAVVTAVDGVCDVVPDGAALLVAPDDAEALASSVRRVLTDPALATHLSGAARRASTSWSPQAMVAGYRRVYADALGGRPPAGEAFTPRGRTAGRRAR